MLSCYFSILFIKSFLKKLAGSTTIEGDAGSQILYYMIGDIIYSKSISPPGDGHIEGFKDAKNDSGPSCFSLNALLSSCIFLLIMLTCL